jgi:hypothetical protein
MIYIVYLIWIYIQMRAKCCALHVEDSAYHELLIRRLTGEGSSINVKTLAVASLSMWCSRLIYYVISHCRMHIFPV